MPTLTFNRQLPLRDLHAGNPGSCIHRLGLDVCFDEYNYNDSLQVYVIEEMGHLRVVIIRISMVLHIYAMWKNSASVLYTSLYHLFTLPKCTAIYNIPARKFCK